jgi:hypothetical protein
LDRETGEVFQRRLTPSREEVGDWIRSLPAPVAVVYEAGPTKGQSSGRHGVMTLALLSHKRLS